MAFLKDLALKVQSMRLHEEVMIEFALKLLDWLTFPFKNKVTNFIARYFFEFPHLWNFERM